MPQPMRRIVTSFGDAEFKRLEDYCHKKKLSLYGLSKAAIREYLERHP